MYEPSVPRPLPSSWARMILQEEHAPAGKLHARCNQFKRLANAAANAAAATHLTAMNVNSVRRALAAFLSGLMPPKLHNIGTKGGFVDLVPARARPALAGATLLSPPPP